MMILATSGQRSCNTRTTFLNYPDRIPETRGQTMTSYEPGTGYHEQTVNRKESMKVFL